jgi:protein-S-isoprenylcysteine O-methyltransferase Ste14
MLASINALFNNHTVRKLFLKLRVLFMLVLVGGVAYYAQPSWLLAGFLVSLFGQAIQFWSFASLVKNDELTARGPYVMVRNPMYLGRYFLILGFVLVTGNVWVVVAYSVFYYFYMVNRVRREEAFLAGELGKPYTDYCVRVNRFFPNLLRLGDPAVYFFSGSVLRNNNGHWNVLATLVAWAALYAYVFYLR